MSPGRQGQFSLEGGGDFFSEGAVPIPGGVLPCGCGSWGQGFGGLGSAGGRVRLGDLGGLFKPRWFHGSDLASSRSRSAFDLDNC